MQTKLKSADEEPEEHPNPYEGNPHGELQSLVDWIERPYDNEFDFGLDYDEFDYDDD